MNQFSDIIICGAQKSQASEIAELIMLAMNHECCLHFCGEGYGLDDFRRMMTALVEREDSQYSYLNTQVAMVDGQLAGILVSYDGSMLHQLREAFFSAALNELGKDHRGMDDETEPGELYLDSLAVKNEFRHCGVATALLKSSIGKARKMDIPNVGLLVDQGNPSAERLYRSIGFKTADETTWGGHPMLHLVYTIEE